MTKKERGLQNISKNFGQVLKRYGWVGFEIPVRNKIITNPSYCSPSPCPSEGKKIPGSFGNHENPQCIRSDRYQNRFPCFHIINLKDLQKIVRQFIFLIVRRKYHGCYWYFIINLHATTNAILSAWANISLEKHKVFKSWLHLLELNAKVLFNDAAIKHDIDLNNNNNNNNNNNSKSKAPL